MLQINRKYFRTFDWYLLIIVLLINIAGILTIYSTTRPVLNNLQASFYIKQMIWVGGGIAVLLFVVSFDYIWLKRFAYPFYLLALLLLIIVLFVGKSSMGAQRWINLGFFSLQPSELFRVVLTIAMARWLSAYKGIITKWTFLPLFTIFGAIPFMFLTKEPDLGTALILLVLFFIIALSKGIERKFLTGIIIFSLLFVAIAGKTLWGKLKNYQKNRIVAFINPNVDPSGIGYQIEQSKITIGSGMLFGKGYLEGTQGPLRFLPEKHTDFIFSVYAEEWGFSGSMFIFFLYFLLITRGFDTAKRARDDFGQFLAIGITFMFLIYFTINMGVVLGMLPVVGVPLPFMSYGGSATMTNFLAIGILINIRMRHFGLFYYE